MVRRAVSNASFMQPHLRHLRSAIPRSISWKAGAARSGTTILVEDIRQFPFQLSESDDASASYP